MYNVGTTQKCLFKYPSFVFRFLLFLFARLVLCTLFQRSVKHLYHDSRTSPLDRMALPPKQYQFLVSVFASLGSLLFGYDLGVIASAIASGNFRHTFGNDPNQMYVVKSSTTFYSGELVADTLFFFTFFSAAP